MIYLEEGNKDMLPYVRATIEPGRWPFEWWYEIHTWEYAEELKDFCWHHYYQKDGGAFSLWRAWRKARETVGEVWMELSTLQAKG